ncbi:MAG: tetratricopeptide repeat protein [Chitinophagaceae bacterium]
MLQKPGPAIKYLLFLILYLLCLKNVPAQTPKLDSLNNLIAKAKTDTDRINLNLRKISLLGKSDLNAAISLANAQVEIAEKINYYKGVLNLRSQLGNKYIFTGDYKKALENIHFLETYVKPEDSISYSGIYTMYGMMYGTKAMYDSSIFYYTKAIELCERLHYDVQLPSHYSNIAISYQQLANYPMALMYQQKGLSLAQKTGDHENEANMLINIANTYYSIGDTVKAIQNYLNADEIAKKIHAKRIELFVYTNLSSIYIDTHDWVKAYDFAMKAANLASETGDVGQQAASLSTASMSLAYQNRFAEATQISKKAIILADSSTQPLNILQAYQGMGLIFFLQKKYKEAIPYFEKSIEALGGEDNYDQNIAEIYKNLSTCYENTGNYQKALKNYQMGVSISDSISKTDNVRKATEVSMNYDFQKKQEVQKAEQVLKDKISRSKQTALLVGLGIFLLLAIAAFAGFKNKQKANALLRQQKAEIESTLGKLKSTQAQLIQSEKMASLGELTAGIAHEIQNPLNFVNNFSEVSNELIDEMNEELEKGDIEEAKAIAADVKQNLIKINHHGNRAGDIVKGMLQHSRSSTGVKEPADINALADEYLRLAYHGLRSKDKNFNATLKTSFDESIGKINVIPQDIGRVILNLITNAFYAVDEKKKQIGEGYEPTVSITTKKINHTSDSYRIEINVADNGNGIPSSIKEKIFQPFFTTKPTGQGTGLGLSLSYDIVKAHGGELQMETKEGEGSTFIIQLPG